MAEYYYNQYERKGKKRSLLMIVIDSVMIIVSLVAFAAMALTLITSHYDPSINWIFPVLGLLSPAVYIVTSILALYWIIRWRLLLACSLLLPLIIGAPAVSRYLKIETGKEYGDLPRRGVVRLMSYNVKEFIGDDKQASTTDMSSFIDEQRPDIICFQEFKDTRMTEEDEPEFFKGYNRVFSKGLAIYSRYKILESSQELINAEFDSGNAFWADLLINSDTVRLYNIHLHSTAITGRDDEYISNMEFLGDTISDSYIRGMLSRFRNTSIGRAAQADTIANSIAQTPHRVVVCGDFNDTPNSYAYRKIGHGLKDSFQEAGVGYSYTFRGFKNLLRIDYIFVDEPTQVLSYQVFDTVLLSDHLPVMTILKL